jgi:hypothetical protein
MGVPTSEVGYTSATTRRGGTMKSIRDMWRHWIKKNTYPYMIGVILNNNTCIATYVLSRH